MLFLIALIIAFGFAFLCGKPLKKYPYIFYVAAVVITVVTVILQGSNLHALPAFVNTYIIGLFTRGALATALWCVVMWAGAMPNGSTPIKKLMPIRGELSIFAALLTLGHNIGFGRTYFVMLFTNTSRVSSNQIAAGVLSIILLVIMIPLTVMSIPQIRKKMDAKLWKRIQRTAYVFYALLFTHVMILSFPYAKLGREGYLFSIFVYSVVFIGYAVCRIRKWIILRKKPENTLILNIVCAVVFAVLVAGVTFCARAKSAEHKENETTDTQVVFTVPATTSVSGTTPVTATTVSTKETSSSDTTDVTAETEVTTTTVIDVTETSTDDQVQGDIEDDAEQDYEEYDDYDDYDNYNVYDDYGYDQSYDQGNNQSPAQDAGPSYIYRNGTYSASAYGYDGDVHVTITIENDVITSISGYTDESDTWYYESAQGTVIPQILSTQSTNVDAYSGATYSSEAIMQAVQSALNSARN